MTFAITAAVLSGVATTVAVVGQVKSAKAQGEELLRQADQEKTAAESRELVRRQALNKALAANVVGQSMSGISGEGTPSSIALESAKQASISEGVIGLSDKLRQSQLKRQAKNTVQAGNIAAGSTLLSGAANTAKLGM